MTVTRILSEVNGPYRRLRLCGLCPDRKYRIRGKYLSYEAYGDELIQFGMRLEDKSSGQVIDGSGHCEDFCSDLYEITAV